jgi:hypothetical protein
MTTMQTIERAAEKLSQAYALRNDIIDQMEKAIAAIEASEMPKFRKAMAKLTEQHEALKAMIQASPELFASPRTVTLHGIKLGFQKGKGKLVFGDEEKLIERIRKVCPDMASTLIVASESVSKTELAKLPADLLRRLGASVIDSGDQIVIKAVDTDHDKLADLYLKAGSLEQS